MNGTEVVSETARARALAWTLWLLPLWLLAAGLTGQRQGPSATEVAMDRLHPFLRAQVAAAAPDARLPVYFVLAGLGQDHWFPRVRRLPLPVRRAAVIAELRVHAARTQAPLREYLAAEVAAGNARGLACNWLGNFVQVEATPLVILTAAAMPLVESAWSDAPPEAAAVPDSAAVPAHALRVAGPAGAPFRTRVSPAPLGMPPAALPPTPGDAVVQTRAALVWAYGILGQGVRIANVDGGLTAHQDLDGRRWTNAGEVAGNGIDDDQNGLVDDVHGWNFEQGTPQLDDGGGHGTATAGLLVADGTCSGIAHGQAPAAQVMTCRVLSETSHWNAVQYAVAMGADVQTSSFSYKATFVPPPNYRLHRDVATASLAAGLIRCNSTGNDGAFCGDPTRSNRRPLNVAAPGCVPSPYLDPNQPAGGISGVIGVGAWNLLPDALDPVSPCGPFAWHLADVLVNVPGYPSAQWDPVHHDDYPWQQGACAGLLKPDVVGPAGNTTTSAGPCGTVTFAGTSNATPCVAGAIALWKCANPSLTPEDAAMIVHQTATDRGAVAGKENGWGAGILDAEHGLYRALCVHRVDFESAWHVEHSLATPAVHLAIDGVPGSLAAVVVGYQRAPVAISGIWLGIGQPFGVVFAGVTDAAGDLAATVGVATNLAGERFVTQAVLWDQTWTQRILDSNVVGIAFVP